MTVSIVLCIIVAVICALALISYRKKLQSGCCGGGDTAKVKSEGVKDKNKSHYPYEAVIEIDGMVCSNCSKHIENELNKLEGIWATVDLRSKTGTILSKGEIDEQAIRDTVNGLGGYTVMKFERKK